MSVYVNFLKAGDPKDPTLLRFYLNNYRKIRKYQYIPSKTSPLRNPFDLLHHQYIPSRIKVLTGRLCQLILHPCSLLLPLPLMEVQWTWPPNLRWLGPWQRYEACAWCPKPLELWSYKYLTVALTITQALPTNDANCRDTICSPSPSPKCMRSWPNKPSTINL